MAKLLDDDLRYIFDKAIRAGTIYCTGMGAAAGAFLLSPLVPIQVHSY
jgi:hypothetical protein